MFIKATRNILRLIFTLYVYMQEAILRQDQVLHVSTSISRHNMTKEHHVVLYFSSKTKPYSGFFPIYDVVV